MQKWMQIKSKVLTEERKAWLREIIKKAESQQYRLNGVVQRAEGLKKSLASKFNQLF